MVDARGLSCPMPVLMVKKAMQSNEDYYEVMVDATTPCENVKRFAESEGYRVDISENDGEFLLKLTKGDAVNVPKSEGESASNRGTNSSYAVFFNSESIGTNEGELGSNLAKMAIFTLSESDQHPDYMLFMNEGVKLVAGDCEQQIVDNLNSMIDKGTKVLVCGTCLNVNFSK